MDKHYGHFDGKRLVAPSFIAKVKSYPVGTNIEMTCRKSVRPKTIPQCRYLHTLFGIVADTLNSEGMGDGTKWTMEKVKEWCKAQGCYPTETVRLKGVDVEVTKQTRELSKEDAMVTIDRVMNYWAEFGIILPAPNEQLEIIKP